MLPDPRIAAVLLDRYDATRTAVPPVGCDTGA
jgi:hypothetical protein